MDKENVAEANQLKRKFDSMESEYTDPMGYNEDPQSRDKATRCQEKDPESHDSDPDGQDSDSEYEWVEEEYLTLVELEGITSSNLNDESLKNFKMLGVHTTKPMLQVS